MTSSDGTCNPETQRDSHLTCLNGCVVKDQDRVIAVTEIVPDHHWHFISIRWLNYITQVDDLFNGHILSHFSVTYIALKETHPSFIYLSPED